MHSGPGITLNHCQSVILVEEEVIGIQVLSFLRVNFAKVIFSDLYSVGLLKFYPAVQSTNMGKVR